MSGWTEAMITKRELTAETQARINRHAVAGRRADLGNQHFRSKMEANLARYLNWLQGIGAVTKWEYETETFRFKSEAAVKANEWYKANKDKRRLWGISCGVVSYKIDFKIWFKGAPEPVYWEVKGYMCPKSKTKLKRMAEYFPWIKIEVIDAKAYKVIANGYRGSISTWE